MCVGVGDKTARRHGDVVKRDARARASVRVRDGRRTMSNVVACVAGCPLRSAVAICEEYTQKNVCAAFSGALLFIT